ncbi:uncharacterized protein cntd1 isoform X1 [Syngnathoides biaculeatus]|uniref:uncharacterized protein cntd1 isoform X1 n=1 Tax=Syngnathoides biaculeatus TaxID=300417 RepID=UPI002ADD8883|nr:uncharacterized protein cntd1 isoform X1 [Syngnathoides biaculeatus]
MAMARQSQASPQSFKFRRASFEMLTDCLANLNEKNKDNLRSLSTSSGIFKEKIIFEYTLQICQELRLDPPTAYHAVELLQKFMVKHITNLLTPAGASRVETSAREDAAFEQLQGKFVLIVFSCVQLASKLSLHSQIIDINMGVRFLRSVGLDFSKQAVLESELMVLKGLEFRLDPPNPLTYVEILLEVLDLNLTHIRRPQRAERPRGAPAPPLLPLAPVCQPAAPHSLQRPAGCHHGEPQSHRRAEREVHGGNGRLHAPGCGCHRRRRLHPPRQRLGAGGERTEPHHRNFHHQHQRFRPRHARARRRNPRKRPVIFNGLLCSLESLKYISPDVHVHLQCVCVCVCVFCCMLAMCLVIHQSRCQFEAATMVPVLHRHQSVSFMYQSLEGTEMIGHSS